MSEQRKAHPSVAALERAEETRATDNDRSVSHSNDSTEQERGQVGFISQFLLEGAKNGLHLSDLARITRLSERDVRKQIHLERRSHIPILSNNRDGYFLPGCDHERTACVKSLRHRAAEILAAAEAIEKAGR